MADAAHILDETETRAFPVIARSQRRRGNPVLREADLDFAAMRAMTGMGELIEHFEFVR